jgi:cytochrome c oxidase subunit 4
MSTTSEHVTTADSGHAESGDAHATHEDAHAPHPDVFYIKIALFLAVLTALETSTYWVDFGPFFLPALLGMMTVKFFTVVLFFMHLKEDAKVFGMLFYMGLGLAVAIYVVMLLCFRFFG